MRACAGVCMCVCESVCGVVGVGVWWVCVHGVCACVCVWCVRVCVRVVCGCGECALSAALGKAPAGPCPPPFPPPCVQMPASPWPVGTCF